MRRNERCRGGAVLGAREPAFASPAHQPGARLLARGWGRLRIAPPDSAAAPFGVREQPPVDRTVRGGAALAIVDTHCLLLRRSSLAKLLASSMGAHSVDGRGDNHYPHFAADHLGHLEP